MREGEIEISKLRQKGRQREIRVEERNERIACNCKKKTLNELSIYISAVKKRERRKKRIR